MAHRMAALCCLVRWAFRKRHHTNSRLAWLQGERELRSDCRGKGCAVQHHFLAAFFAGFFAADFLLAFFAIA
jgi:hypothetical protein